MDPPIHCSGTTNNVTGGLNWGDNNWVSLVTTIRLRPLCPLSYAAISGLSIAATRCTRLKDAVMTSLHLPDEEQQDDDAGGNQHQQHHLLLLPAMLRGLSSVAPALRRLELGTCTLHAFDEAIGDALTDFPLLQELSLSHFSFGMSPPNRNVGDLLAQVGMHAGCTWLVFCLCDR